MEDEQRVRPRAGMTISVRTREEVVVVDPDRVIAAARAALVEDDPEMTEEQAARHVVDVYDAVDALVEHHGGRLAPETMSLAQTHGRRSGRANPDGLDPVGYIRHYAVDDPVPLRHLASCFRVPDHDPFATPPDGDG
ncbi:hypothetical protein ABH931_003743 [Streptacidiphilus sp. MAP12-33]|uniref:hypothetical protein n=1 Tax=Streptacidiphilus sp. MAP12-33 TaxID=3156266 RepID=UPI003513593E